MGPLLFIQSNVIQLRSKSSRVSREERGPSNVLKIKEKHDDSLETDTSTGMRGSAVSKSIDVVLKTQRLGINLVGSHSLLEELGVVDSLGSRQNLLSSHEEVVGVGVVGVLGIGHGVERSHGQREFVENVKVGVVLLSDNLSEQLLVLGGEILVIADVLAGLSQQLDTLGEGQLDHLSVLGQLELLDGVLLSHGGNIVAVSLLQLGEDENEELGQHVNDLVVVLLEGHLQIETGELGHVSVGVGVLRSEDGGNLEHSLKVAGHEHLLVQLGGLGQEGVALEVVELEDVGSSLRGSGNHLGSVDLNEALGDQELPEQLADAVLDSEDGLVGGGSQIDASGIESGVEVDDGQTGGLGLSLGSRSVLNQNRRLLGGLGNHKELGDGNLNVLDGGGLDRLRRLDNSTLDEHNGFQRDGAGKLDHLLRDGVGVDGQQTLDVGRLLSERHKAHLVALETGSVDSGSEHNLLATHGLVEVLDLDPLDTGLVLLSGLDHGQHAVVGGGVVDLLGLSLGLLSGQSGRGLCLLSLLLLLGLQLLESLLRQRLAIGTQHDLGLGGSGLGLDVVGFQLLELLSDLVDLFRHVVESDLCCVEYKSTDESWEVEN